MSELVLREENEADTALIHALTKEAFSTMSLIDCVIAEH